MTETPEGAGPSPARCFWVPDDDELYADYHDREWGMPVADDVRLFEKLTLESFQSGLSWRTILGKRENFRRAFAGFDVERVARFDTTDVDRLLGDTGIVRHRGKIEAAVANARACCEIVGAEGSLAAFVWRHEPSPAGRPDILDEATLRTLTTSPAAKALAGELKKRGWRFVGPTTAYAFMQSMGIVNDHLEGCATRGGVESERKAFRRP